MGRPVGSKNQPKRALQQAIEDRLKRVYGKDFDVLMELADQCVKIRDTADSTGTIADRRESVQALNTLARYITPQLKATEISGPEGSGLTVSIQRKKYDGSTNEPEV
jgi:uncharacterized protein YeeX (DUF496 family)